MTGSDDRKRGEQQAAGRSPAALEDTAQSPDDRVSRGVGLLFGDLLAEFRHRLERLEAEGEDRLGALERGMISQAALLDELEDKARGALEREDAEYKRRRIAEAELREATGRHRAEVEAGFEETRLRLRRFEEKQTEQLEALQCDLRETHPAEKDPAPEEIQRQLDRLADTKLERSELAALLSGVARDMSRD